MKRKNESATQSAPKKIRRSTQISPIYAAIQANNLDAVRELIDGSKENSVIDITVQELYRFLRCAVRNGRVDIIRYFIDEKKCGIDGLLSIAIAYGKFYAVRLLIENYGAELNSLSAFEKELSKAHTKTAKVLEYAVHIVNKKNPISQNPAEQNALMRIIGCRPCSYSEYRNYRYLVGVGILPKFENIMDLNLKRVLFKMNVNTCQVDEFAKFAYDANITVDVESLDYIECVFLDDKLRILASTGYYLSQRFPNRSVALASKIITEFTLDGVKDYLKLDRTKLQNPENTLHYGEYRQAVQSDAAYNEVMGFFNNQRGREFIALSACIPAIDTTQIKDPKLLRGMFTDFQKAKSAARDKAVYMCIALECDTPILEAMYVNAVSGTPGLENYLAKKDEVDAMWRAML